MQIQFLGQLLALLSRRMQSPSISRKRVTGATRKDTVRKKSGSQLLPQVAWRRWLARTAVASLLGVTAMVVLNATRWVHDLPITDIHVEGASQGINTHDIVQLVEPYAEAGFCCVALGDIKHELEAHPWVALASVKRVWPGALHVSVMEHDVVARWGEAGLLARNGQVFKPEFMPDLQDLPLFVGDEAYLDNYVDLFNQLQRMMNEYGVVVSELKRSDKGSWKAQLANTVMIELGEKDLQKKLVRLERVLAVQLGEQFDDVAAIDLRYGNGVAVAWTSSRDVMRLAKVDREYSRAAAMRAGPKQIAQ